jgi:hypothetical protein
MLFALGGVAVGSGAVAWFCMAKRSHGADAASHTLRLASEIIAVAETIEDDVAVLRDEPRFTRVAQRCRECAERAREALKQRKSMRSRDAEALTQTWLLLHDDHRRIVDLRSDTDRALASWAESHEQDGNWASRFASTLSAGWSSTLSKARPSAG